MATGSAWGGLAQVRTRMAQPRRSLTISAASRTYASTARVICGGITAWRHALGRIAPQHAWGTFAGMPGGLTTRRY